MRACHAREYATPRPRLNPRGKRSRGSGTSGSSGNRTADGTFTNLHPNDIPDPAFVPFRGVPRNGRFLYVVTEDGRLVLAKPMGIDGRRRIHIDLAGGKPVRAAGEVQFVGGRARTIDNGSGHYRPRGADVRQAAQDAFETRGYGRGNYVDVGGGS